MILYMFINIYVCLYIFIHIHAWKIFDWKIFESILIFLIIIDIWNYTDNIQD